MPVTELAILRLPSTDPPSQLLLQGLSTAKTAMEAYSGYPFSYFQCLEDPCIIYIFGAWSSVDFHMNHWIPSHESQDLLKLLNGLLTVDVMFHIDIDQSITGLPIWNEVVAIERHFVKAGQLEEFEKTFEQEKKYLDAVIGKENAVGGWRIDRDGEREEFVLFSGWGSEERHLDFTKMEQNVDYARISHFVDRTDVQHARQLDISGNGNE